MKCYQDEPEDFILAKKMFYIANMTELFHTSLNYLIEAKELFTLTIKQNNHFLSAYYYLGMTLFRIGIIRAEKGNYQSAIEDFKKAKESFEIVKYCEEFKDDLYDLMPSLNEAYSYALEQTGVIIYENENLKNFDCDDLFSFLSMTIM